MMRLLSLLTAGVALAAVLTGPSLVSQGTLPTPISSAWAQGACEPGDRPDNTTAADAKKKLETAGYRQARDLKKGCDNVWHGKAVKDGRPVNVALSPRGEIYIETE